MIEIRNYRKLKQKKAVTVARVGDGYAINITKFDPVTGDRLPSETVAFDRRGIEQAKAELQSTIDDLDALIADMDATDKP